MTNEELSAEFQEKHELFRRLQKEALFALEDSLGRASIKYHSLPSRIKELDSFLRKVRSREAIGTDAGVQDCGPFESIHDIVGLRVVCLFLSDVERIGQVIRDTFKVRYEDNKIEG